MQGVTFQRATSSLYIRKLECVEIDIMSITLTCLSCGQANRIPTDRLNSQPKCGACAAHLLGSTPKDVSFDILEKAQRIDDIPLVVDFWATWCQPCRMMAPEFATAAQALSGKARFAKLDTEAFPAAGARFGIRGIPLLLAFRRGQEIGRHAGLASAQDVVGWVNASVGQ